ncbi:MAG: hypothetical protein ACOYU6_05360 [Bacteroidota bacterium]|uniref:hypothetical protein n=1 Tax=Hydrotalea lipotrueae TaxID=2803817 RepID=UPI001C44B0DA|nr:hypothetical protein [Hydrotalea lipotrueae]
MSVADATKKQGVGTAIRPVFSFINVAMLLLMASRRMFSTTPNFLCSIGYGKSFYHHWLSVADATKKQGVGAAIRPVNSFIFSAMWF